MFSFVLINRSICRWQLKVTDLDGVGLPAPHVELVVAHAESEDPLVDPQPRREEHEVRRLRIDWLDHELAVVERNVPVGGGSSCRCELLDETV